MFFAYIDPGAGSMVIQAILAGILGVPFVFPSQLSRLVTWVRGRSRSPDPTHDD